MEMDEVKEDKAEAAHIGKKEISDRLDYLKKNILTLEWDKRHNQLNRGMERRFEELKKEYDELRQKLGAEVPAEQAEDATAAKEEPIDFFEEKETEPEAEKETKEESEDEEEFDFMKGISEESSEGSEGEEAQKEARENERVAVKSDEDK